jgi:transcription elongation factor SPT6
VLALTNGKGERSDAVIAVHLDALGNIRSQTKFDDLTDPKRLDAFLSIFRRSGETKRRSNAPSVVVVGGLSVYANRLKNDVANALRKLAGDEVGLPIPDPQVIKDREEFAYELRTFDERVAPQRVPLIMPSDVTARIYMDSDEGKLEQPNLPSNGRYALALARYTQNPLNAYAKLGKGLTGVTFMEHHQRLVRCSSSSLQGRDEDKWLNENRCLRISSYSISSAAWSTLCVRWVSTSGHACRSRTCGPCCRLLLVWDLERRMRCSKRRRST